MFTENHIKTYGTYNSRLKDYIVLQNNYDGAHLIYTNKYGPPAFTITRPSTLYQNCRFIQNYPHFDIPVECCMKEIQDFIDGRPLYSKDFCIRFGDTHPDKLIPKLGQMRNLFLGDIWSSLVSGNGKVDSIYLVGDISEKSVYHYLNSIPDTGQKDTLNLLTRLVMAPSTNHPLYTAYKKQNLSKIHDTLQPFLEKFMIVPTIMLESELYNDAQLFKYITKEINFKNGKKDNGNPKYALQELMFLLCQRFANARIISILGDNQSDHVAKVLKILRDNQLQVDAAFLKYGWCENALSTNHEEWLANITNYLRTAGHAYITDATDFLRIIVCASSNTAKLNFSSLSGVLKYMNMFAEIIHSIIIADTGCSCFNVLPEMNSLIGQMSLVFQEWDQTIVSGEQSRFFRYLLALSREFTANASIYNKSSSFIYAQFMRRALKLLALDKTTMYQKTFSRL